MIAQRMGLWGACALRVGAHVKAVDAVLKTKFKTIKAL